MKYLSKRDDFLRNSKLLESKKDFLRNSNLTGLQTYNNNNLNEANSGPMANDIGWNDSLLGRFVNHLTRKAKVAAGLVRIKPVINRLEETFESILTNSVLVKQDSETRKNTAKIILYSFFNELKQSIEDGDDLKIVMDLTKEAQKNILKYENFDEKDSLNSELDKFIEFLETLDTEDVQIETENTTIDSSYTLMLENLKSLLAILNSDKIKVEFKIDPKGETNLKGYKLQLGDTISKISAKSKKECDIIRSKNPALAKFKDDDDLSTLISDKDVYLVLENTQNINITAQSLLKLKNSVSFLINPKEKIAVDSSLISDILKNEAEYKDSIVNIYKEINRYLVGDKVQTLNYTPDKLHESTESVIKYKYESVAQKIAKFSKRIQQIVSENILFGGDLDISIRKFNETLKKINLIKSEKNDESNESKLSYGYFLKINESDESETSDPSTNSKSQKIRDYFDLKCKGVKEFTINKTEVDKIRLNIEKSSKETTFCIIDGMDPIIEIMRLFNRAYKIYTVETITKRSDGAGQGTLGEYTAFGSGGENGKYGTGPYRNNKIFNQWENAVTNIMGNRKYEFLFNKNTSLRIPNKPNPSSDGDWDVRKNAGAILRKFITDLLDGEKLYKKGTQSKFLESYFGNSETKESDLGFPGDVKNNEEIVSKILENEIKLKFRKIKTPQDFKINTFFTLDCKDGDLETQRSFFIQDIDNNGYVYLSYCVSFGTFKRYLDMTDIKKSVSKGDFNRLSFSLLNQKGQKWEIKYTRIKKADLSKMLTVGSSIKIKFNYNNKGEGEETLKIFNSYWLIQEKEGNSVLYSIDSDAAKKQLSEAIKQNGYKPTLIGALQQNSIINIA